MGNSTLSVSILSGKGGVGKTSLCLNLGYSLFSNEESLILMDCDMGLANIDVMLGLTPEKNLQDIMDLDLDPEDVIVPLEKPGRFDFLPAASGVPELIEMDEHLRYRLFRRLEPLFSRYDYLFLDLGAGISPTVVSLAVMSRVRLVVVTPEPTSLTDSYAMIKVLATQHDIKDYHVIVNMIESKADEKQTFERLKAACQRFLNVDIHFLGSVRADNMVSEAIRRQTPLMKMAPNSPAAQDISKLAQNIRQLREGLLPSLARQPLLNNFPSQFDLEHLEGKE